MSAISVWTFDTAGGAEDALRLLERLQVRRVIVVDDASVVVRRGSGSRLHTYQVGAADGSAAMVGAFWGLLFGVLFLLPMLRWEQDGLPQVGLAQVGLPDAFLRRVRGRVVGGRSALFLLTPHAALDHLHEALIDSPRSPLVRLLTDEQHRALRLAFGADDGGADDGQSRVGGPLETPGPPSGL